MILVRDIFHLKFGKAKEARALLKEGMELAKKNGLQAGRASTDLTGRSYRLVLELTFKDLTEFESTLKKAFGDPEWEKWYQKFTPLVESGDREIFTILE